MSISSEPQISCSASSSHDSNDNVLHVMTGRQRSAIIRMFRVCTLNFMQFYVRLLVAVNKWSVCAGAMGAICSIMWFFLVFDSPAQHPRISTAERDYIEKALNTQPAQKVWKADFVTSDEVRPNILDTNISTLWDCESKRDLYTFAHNFGRCWRIFEIFPLLKSSRNLQQTDCHIAHHTLNVLLHYLVKWQLSQTAIFISKQCIQHQYVPFLTRSVY